MNDPQSEDLEAAFQADIVTYGLRFRCAACAHVIPSTRRCSMAYPNRDLVGPVRARRAGIPVVCKYFELGESELSE